MNKLNTNSSIKIFEMKTMKILFAFCGTCFFCAPLLSQFGNSFFFPKRYQNIKEEGNFYRFYFKNEIKKKDSVLIEIYSAPFNGRIFYQEQILSYLNDKFGDKFKLKIYHYVPDENKFSLFGDKEISDKSEAKRQLALEKFFPKEYNQYLLERSKYTYPVPHPPLNLTYNLAGALKRIKVDQTKLDSLSNTDEIEKEFQKRNKIAIKKLEPIKGDKFYKNYNPQSDSDSLFGQRFANMVWLITGYPDSFSPAMTSRTKDTTDEEILTQYSLKNPISVTVNKEEFYVTTTRIWDNLFNRNKKSIERGDNCPIPRIYFDDKTNSAKINFMVAPDATNLEGTPVELKAIIKHKGKIKNDTLHKLGRGYWAKIQLSDLEFADRISIKSTIQKIGYHATCEDFEQEYQYGCPSIKSYQYKKSKEIYLQLKDRKHSDSKAIFILKSYDKEGNLIRKINDFIEKNNTSVKIKINKDTGYKVCYEVTVINPQGTNPDDCESNLKGCITIK